MLVNIQLSNRISRSTNNSDAVEKFIYYTKLYHVMLSFAILVSTYITSPNVPASNLYTSVYLYHYSTSLWLMDFVQCTCVLELRRHLTSHCRELRLRGIPIDAFTPMSWPNPQFPTESHHSPKNSSKAPRHQRDSERIRSPLKGGIRNTTGQLCECNIGTQVWMAYTCFDIEGYHMSTVYAKR